MNNREVKVLNMETVFVDIKVYYAVCVWRCSCLCRQGADGHVSLTVSNCWMRLKPRVIRVELLPPTGPVRD